MEPSFYTVIPAEEKILEKLREDERTIAWLARKAGKSRSYVFCMLRGKGYKKVELTDQILNVVKNIYPDLDLT